VIQFHSFTFSINWYCFL